jgi:hypothetical protein
VHGVSQNSDRGGSTDPTTVRDALRAELTARGHRVASDTLGLGHDLYIIGANDLAKALFHFDEDAGLLAQSMYRGSGSWVEGMPPRFAVLPAIESGNPSFGMIEQMRATPLLYDIDAGHVAFRELDRLLAEHIDV